VRKVSHESVVIEWNLSSDDGGRRISRYVVQYRDNDDLHWHRAVTVDGYTTSCTVSGLKENREYLFRVVASNEIGESDPLEVDLAVRPQRQAGEWALSTIPVIMYQLYFVKHINFPYFIK
jgi:hypothetical protein